MRTTTRFFVFALMVCCLARSGEAQLVRLGTIAPKDSSFHKVLLTMGEQWRQQNVKLKVFAGGMRGGEAEMVRHMRSGSLDAALLTANGLSDIDPSVQALQDVPMMYRSLAEVEYVGKHLRPRISKRLRDKGFVVLFWADAGWVRFFSTKPVVHPQDLKRLKLFTWAGETFTVDLLKKSGFHPVPLETNDILPSLQTGMIEAVAMPPYIAVTMQTFVHARNMLLLDWAPLVGALVIREETWNRFPPEVQRELAMAAAEAGRKMQERNRAESEAAVQAMRARGLKVTDPAPAVREEWRAAAETSYPAIRSRKIGPELFDEVMRLLAEYRASQNTVSQK